MQGYERRRRFLSMGILALGLLVFTSCMSKSAYMREKNRANGLSRTLEDYKNYQDSLAARNTMLEAENRHLKSAVDASFDYKKKKAELEEILANMRRRVAVGGPSEGVTVFQGPDGSTGLRIQGDLLFGPGQDKVTAEGRTTLAGLVSIINEGRGVRIAGHSDSDPIRNSSWKSNLHLSAARALSVALYLQKKGVPMNRMSVQGYGASQPISGANKAKNRRVEIFLLK
jgi:flagellar motor protein MotB